MKGKMVPDNQFFESLKHRIRNCATFWALCRNYWLNEKRL